MHILLTGGSGFIGQRLAHRLKARADSVTALVRRTSARQELERAGVRFAIGDLMTGEGLPEALEGVDCVIHLAGVTKARAPEDYFRGNAEGTRRLVEAMARQPKPPRLVHVSSLAAAGPSAVGRPRREHEAPAPVSHYGKSKLGAEQAVREFAHRIPSVIVRPPLVYGPGDKEFIPSLLPMARFGLYLKSGFGTKEYSAIHVDDLCEALIAAAEKGRTLSLDDPGAGVYHVSDGHAHTWQDVCTTLSKAMGKLPLAVLPVPDVVSYAAGVAGQLQALVRGTVPMVSLDKAKEMRCEAWTCAIDRAREELGFSPAFTLEQGLKHTVEWYRREGQL